VAVNLAKMNADLFMSALIELRMNPHERDGIIWFGASEWYNPKTGESVLRQNRDVNALKRAYSKQVVLSQAKRFGWGVKVENESQFVMMKGGI